MAKGMQKTDSRTQQHSSCTSLQSSAIQLKKLFESNHAWQLLNVSSQRSCPDTVGAVSDNSTKGDRKLLLSHFALANGIKFQIKALPLARKWRTELAVPREGYRSIHLRVSLNDNYFPVLASSA